MNAERSSDRHPAIRLQRAYDEEAHADGYRVLVDRLWPRGIRRDALHVDEWCRQIAPSTELRRWFGHDPARWLEFVARYRAELAGRPDVARLAGHARAGALTLVYAAADPDHNNAVVLRDVLEEELTQP